VLLCCRRSAKDKEASYLQQKERYGKLLEQAVIHQRTEDWVLKQAMPPESESESEPEPEPEPEPELGLRHGQVQQEGQKEESAGAFPASMHDDGTGVGFTHRIDGSPAQPQVHFRTRSGEKGGIAATSHMKREQQEKQESDWKDESGLRVLCVTWNLNGKIPDADLGKIDAGHHVHRTNSCSRVCSKRLRTH
jgi:hypothetical protein